MNVPPQDVSGTPPGRWRIGTEGGRVRSVGPPLLPVHGSACAAALRHGSVARTRAEAVSGQRMGPRTDRVAGILPNRPRGEAAARKAPGRRTGWRSGQGTSRAGRGFLIGLSQGAVDEFGSAPPPNGCRGRIGRPPTASSG